MTVAGLLDLSPGYARLTVDDVNVDKGFTLGESIDQFPNVGEKPAGFPDYEGVEGYTNAPAVDDDITGDTKVFAIAIHSVDDGAAGVGNGMVGDPSSIIGVKLKEPGEYEDVDVPIYPVALLTDVREIEGEGPDQQFPPRGEGDPPRPTVQAAVYKDGLDSEPAAMGEPVEVTGSLDQNDSDFDEKDPLGPGDLEGPFDPIDGGGEGPI